MDIKPRKETFDVTSTSGEKKSNIPEKLRAEIERYGKKGGITEAELIELAAKYKDEGEAFIQEFLRLSAKRHQKIVKQAREVAEKVYRKYNDGTRTLHEILERMMKYKREHKWSDAEYDEFRKELSYLLSGNRAMEIDLNQNLIAFRSRINRTLGASVTITESLNIKDSEHGVLSEILSMYEKYAPLHRQVFMYSLMYEDCSLVALTGEYKRERHIASNYIHPLIACLYIPKFDSLEIHTLYSNFGSIIKCRYEKKPIVTEPDALLFYDITTDPNDVVCEISSPITDLRNRYKVQVNLWETVIKLRNGNYYEATPISEFLSYLNACRNNLYDNVDLAYNQDEGAILRRFLSVFSLRPTIIATKPIYAISSLLAGPCNNMGLAMSMGMGMSMGSQQSSMPFYNQPTMTITSIPMITLQLPPHGSENDEPKNLAAALSQTIWINENKTIIPKEQSIIYSKEILIFYVNRRVQRIQFRTFTNPITFSQLPLTMSSFERLNDYPVNAPDRIALGAQEELYELRSVVAVTETEIKQGEKTTNIITGCTGLIIKRRDIIVGRYEPEYYLYDPFGASIPVKHPEPTIEGHFANKPISFLNGVFSSNSGGIINPSFFERAQRAGTIFIYAKPTGYNTNEIISI